MAWKRWWWSIQRHSSLSACLPAVLLLRHAMDFPSAHFIDPLFHQKKKSCFSHRLPSTARSVSCSCFRPGPFWPLSKDSSKWTQQISNCKHQTSAEERNYRYWEKCLFIHLIAPEWSVFVLYYVCPRICADHFKFLLWREVTLSTSVGFQDNFWTIFFFFFLMHTSR